MGHFVYFKGDHPDVMCRHCSKSKDNIKALLNHIIMHHDGQLKYRQKQFDHVTGQYIYRTQSYSITIEELKEWIKMGFFEFLSFNEFSYQASFALILNLDPLSNF